MIHNNKERVDKYLNSLNPIELMDYMAKQAREATRTYKAMVRAVDLEGWAYENKESRAMCTTLNAKAENCARIYRQNLELLKYLINEL